MAQKYNAPVICLQETHLKDDQMSLKGYIAYQKTGTIDDMDIPHRTASLHDLTHLESHLPKPFVIVRDINSYNYFWERIKLIPGVGSWELHDQKYQKSF